MTDLGLKELTSRVLPFILGTRVEQRLSILTYHRVMDDVDFMRPTEPTVENFDWQMRLLNSCFNPLRLSEAVARLKNGSLPERAVAITFDDGYADNYSLALPILKKWGVPATVFVASRYLDGGAMWNDRIIEAFRNLPNGILDLRSLGIEEGLIVSGDNKAVLAQQFISLVKHWEPSKREEAVEGISSMAGNPECDFMLNSEQLSSLQDAGVEIGGHTYSHPILAAVGEDEARREILQGKEQLEGILNTRLKVFAYPNGKKKTDFTGVHKKLVANAGFEAAVSTVAGVSSARSDPYELPRFTPWDSTPLRFLVRLHANRRNVSVAH